MPVEPAIRSAKPIAVVPAEFVALATVVLSTIMVIATIAILYFLREIFIPLSLAILLAFVLAPAMRLLGKLGVPRAVGAVTIVLLAFAVIVGLATVMGSGVRNLAENLPRYQTVLHDKIQTIRGMTAGSHTLDQAASILQNLNKELQGAPQPALDSKGGEQQQPVPVIIRNAEPSALATLSTLITPLLNPLAMMGVIIVFVIFILVRREDLRDRLIRLTGTRDLGRTTAAIDDAAHRLSRFYLTQLALNAGFGLCIGLGLWLIGVPSAATWGILAGVLRFVPYVGALISAVLPLSLAAAIEPGWTKVFEALGMFAVVELSIGQIIEPLLYGHSTGLSPVAVIVSATFWTWLWGPIGLVMAIPLTMCLVVLGRHVERLRFLEVMFGNQPALSPPEIFFQRMLAADPAEAADHAAQFLRKRSLLTYYQEVAMGGLQLAQSDLSSGLLDREQTETIATAANEVVDELSTEDARPSGAALNDDESEAAVAATVEVEDPPLPTLDADSRRSDWGADAVVCVAGTNALDDVAARILAQLLEKHGLPATALPPTSLRSADLFRLDLSRARWICVSSMDGASSAHLRNAVRKLRRKAPQATLVLGLWGSASDREAAGDGDTEGLTNVGSLRDAAEAALLAATGHEVATPETPLPLRSAN